MLALRGTRSEGRVRLGDDRTPVSTLAAEEVRRAFHGVVAVDGVSLELRPGRTLSYNFV